MPRALSVLARGDAWLAAACSGMLGISGILAVAGAASGSVPTLIVAGSLAVVAFVILVGAGWLEALLVLLVTLPLPALYATESVRLSPVLPMSAIVVAAWFLGGGRWAATGRAHWASLSMVALLGALTVASLFAEVPMAAARELVNFALLLGILLAAQDLVRRRPARARAVVRGLAWVAPAVGVAAALEAVGVLPGRFPLAGSGLYRATGGFGWPNELGMFLAISFPFSIHEVRHARGRGARALALAGVVLAGLGLVSTFSRGSWLAVAAAPVVLLAAGEGRFVRRFWGAGILAAIGFDLLTGGAVSTRITGTTGDVLVAQRLLLMAAGLLMLQAHPMLGVGPGGFGDALDRFGPQVSGLFDFVGSAHNGYVHMAAEAGLLGLAGLLGFVASTLWALGSGLRGTPGGMQEESLPGPLRHVRTTCLWSFATVCIVALFEWPFPHGVGELIALVAGVGLALVPGDHP